MITSGIVGTVIGLIFIFFVFSLVVSGINEGLTRAFEWRSHHLWRAMRKLLDGKDEKLSNDQRPARTTSPGVGAPSGDSTAPPSSGAGATPAGGAASPATEPVAAEPVPPGSDGGGNDWTDRIYAHPLISDLEGRRLPRADRTRLSNLPPNDFARALIDLLVPQGQGATTAQQVRDAVHGLDPKVAPMREPLLAIINVAGDDIDKVIGGIGNWFDARMEALSRRYKTHVKWVLLVVGIIVAVALNVDAIDAGERLYRDDALRTAISQEASSLVEACGEESDPSTCATEKVKEIDPALRLPVGWPDQDGIDGIQVLGWLIAGIALGQGAPFWFDLLRKATKLRTTT